ncbi:MAG TPA: RDD family protein [Thermodesulfobacteriota bacterium]|nr:RDD family protein [Thermodesulfobacteriota bacterium]
MRNNRHLIHRTVPGAVLAIIMSLALSSCGGGSPEAALEQMREAACRGDVDAFMSHIDKEEYLRNQRRKAVENAIKRQSGNGLAVKLATHIIGQLYIYGINPFQDEATSSESKSIDARFMEIFAREVGYGESSGFCNFTISGIDSRSSKVTIKFPHADTKQHLYFENSFGSWKMVDLTLDSSGEDKSTGTATPPGDTSAGHYFEEGVPAARPWVRLIARTTDYWIVGIFLFTVMAIIDYDFLTLISSNRVTDTLFGMVGIFIWVFIEPFFLSRFGTTPGKYVLGTYVLNEDKSLLSYKSALNRSIGVWFNGEGLGIPILSLVTNYIAYDRLKNNGITNWDKAGNFLVIHKKIKFSFSLLILAIFWSLILLYLLNTLMKLLILIFLT